MTFRIKMHPDEGLICPDCHHARIACRCDSGDGWCPGCPLCEPMGLAHRIDETEARPAAVCAQTEAIG